MSEENKIRDAGDALKGIVEAVPVYEDAIQPAAKEIGTALQTVAKTIHIVLAPISALVWGYEQIQDFVSTRVATKLKDVPPENIVTPKPNVAGPLLEALRYTGHEESLREMYANLLAAAMDNRTAHGAHPAFVEIIRQLTPGEARLVSLLAQDRPFPLINVRSEFKVETLDKRGGHDSLVHFSTLGLEAGCEIPSMTPSYLDNLCRLGLAEIPAFLQYVAPGIYEALESQPEVELVKRQIEEDPAMKASIERKGLQVTSLGRQFCKVCVVSHEHIERPKTTDT
jgi:hypothetical protein